MPVHIAGLDCWSHARPFTTCQLPCAVPRMHTDRRACFHICHHSQVARGLGLTTGPVAVVVPLSTFGSWEREMAK